MQEKEEEPIVVRSEVIEFQADCPFCWHRLSGTLSMLLFAGEIVDHDDLSLGAGSIVTSAMYSVSDTTHPPRGMTIFEDVLSGTFFDDLGAWIREQPFGEDYVDLNDVTGEDALLVSDMLTLAENMTSHQRSTELLTS